MKNKRYNKWKLISASISDNIGNFAPNSDSNSNYSHSFHFIPYICEKISQKEVHLHH